MRERPGTLSPAPLQYLPFGGNEVAEEVGAGLGATVDRPCSAKYHRQQAIPSAVLVRRAGSDVPTQWADRSRRLAGR
jgi:hypothetical protein